MTNIDKLIELINEFIYHLDKIRTINHYLYEHTELFEKKYEVDYQQELYEYFANKITIWTKYQNTLLKTLTNEQKEKLYYKQMIER